MTEKNKNPKDPHLKEKSPKENKNKKSKLEASKEEVTGLKKVIAEQNDKILRSLAEIENLRKRAAEDLEKTSKYAISKFASELVLVVENFYLAVENMPIDEIEKSEKLKNFTTGITMTQKEMVKIFENNGIKRINPISEAFNHNYHQAIAHVEGGGDPGVVKKVIQAGYMVHDRLIRPALVEVFK